MLGFGLVIQDAGWSTALRIYLQPQVNILVANITTLHIHINDSSTHLGPVCSVWKHSAIVTTLTIVPNGAHAVQWLLVNSPPATD